MRSAALGVPRLAALASLAATLALPSGCGSPSKTVYQLGIPGSRIDMNVSRVTHRGDVLDVWLVGGGGWSLRTFVPASPVCKRVVRAEEGVELASEGYGTLVRDEERCDAIGIGSLREWRKKQPRSLSPDPSPVPSATARYTRIYEDEEVALLRGRFPLTSRVGFSSVGDVIAVLPVSEICRGPIEASEATLEYFDGGEKVLTLGAARGRCLVEGLIRPPTPQDLAP